MSLVAETWELNVAASRGHPDLHECTPDTWLGAGAAGERHKDGLAAEAKACDQRSHTLDEHKVEEKCHYEKGADAMMAVKRAQVGVLEESRCPTRQVATDLVDVEQWAPDMIPEVDAKVNWAEARTPVMRSIGA